MIIAYFIIKERCNGYWWPIYHNIDDIAEYYYYFDTLAFSIVFLISGER